MQSATIDTVTTCHSVDKACAIFESGAAAGYLNQAFYSTQLTEDYTSNCRKIVRESFAGQADSSGKVHLTFHRIYLLAGK